MNLRVNATGGEQTMTSAQFRAARKALGLTQSEIARKLDKLRPVTVRTISRWETGQRVPAYAERAITLRLSKTETGATKNAST